MRARLVLASLIFSASAALARSEDKPLAVEGHVHTVDGKPVEGALVSLGRPGTLDPFHPDDRSGPVTTDKAGAFRIAVRPVSIFRHTPMGAWSTTLRVQAPGLVAQRAFVSQRGEGYSWRSPGNREEKPGPLALALRLPAGILRGVVIDGETRTPVPGVRVMAHEDEVLTGDDGRYQIPLGPGRFVIRLAAGEYLNAVASIEIDSDDVEKTVVLRRGARTLNAQVLDANGAPVPSPVMVVVADEDGNEEQRGKGDSAGRVQVEGVTRGLYTVLVYSLDGGFGFQRGVAADSGPVTIGLTGRRVKLHPEGAAGQSLVNRTVVYFLKRIGDWTVSRSPCADGGLFVGYVETDASGNVEVVVPSGRVEIAVGDLAALGCVTLAPDEDTSVVVPIRPAPW